MDLETCVRKEQNLGIKNVTDNYLGRKRKHYHTHRPSRTGLKLDESSKLSRSHKKGTILISTRQTLEKNNPQNMSIKEGNFRQKLVGTNTNRPNVFHRACSNKIIDTLHAWKQKGKTSQISLFVVDRNIEA